MTPGLVHAAPESLDRSSGIAAPRKDHSRRKDAISIASATDTNPVPTAASCHAPARNVPEVRGVIAAVPRIAAAVVVAQFAYVPYRSVANVTLLRRRDSRASSHTAPTASTNKATPNRGTQRGVLAASSVTSGSSGGVCA